MTDAKLVDRIIQKLYQSTSGIEISLAERNRLNIVDSSFTYGEINPLTFAEILEVAKPEPGEVFYDLGSGTGKAVFCAALLYNWKKCCGVERLDALHHKSQELLKQFSNLALVRQHFSYKYFPVSFIQDDFVKIDFTDADVIFLHATTFGYDILEPLKEKLHLLKPGSRIIIVSKKLEENSFQLIDQSKRMMDWGEGTVLTYVKK